MNAVFLQDQTQTRLKTLEESVLAEESDPGFCVLENVEAPGPKQAAHRGRGLGFRVQGSCSPSSHPYTDVLSFRCTSMYTDTVHKAPCRELPEPWR